MGGGTSGLPVSARTRRHAAGVAGGQWLDQGPLDAVRIPGGTVVRAQHGDSLPWGGPTLPDAARRLALPAVVVIAAGHMAKGLAKFTSWGAFLPHALDEPTGTDTALMISSGSMESPGPWLAMPWVSAVGVLLVVGSPYLAIREARLANPDTAGRPAVPTLALAGCFGLIVFGWGFTS